MRRFIKIISVMALLAMASVPLSAAASASVVQIVGKVSVRSSDAAPWVAATPGMALVKGASVTTGFQSAVVVKIEPTGSVVRLDQFTTVSVASLGQTGDQVDSKLDLKMGTVRAVVKNTPAARSRFEVSTPVATASVRGTIPEISYSPSMGARIVYLQGSGTVRSVNGRVQLLARSQSSRVNSRGQATGALQEANRTRAVAAVDWNLSAAEENVLMNDNTSLIGTGSANEMRDTLRELNDIRNIRDLGLDLEKL